MPDDEVAEKVILLLRDDFLQRDLAGTKQRKARLCVIWPHLAKRPRQSWERLAEPRCPPSLCSGQLMVRKTLTGWRGLSRAQKNTAR